MNKSNMTVQQKLDYIIGKLDNKNQEILGDTHMLIIGDYEPREFADLKFDDCDSIVYEENPKANKLYDTVMKFMKDNDITCEETIHQTDRVIENAYDFITDLFNVVKDDLEFEEGE